MKVIKDEKLTGYVVANRKGGNHTPFEIGAGYQIDDSGDPTGKVYVRTEQIASSNSPAVVTMDVKTAEEHVLALLEAIEEAKKANVPALKLAS